MTAAPMDTPNLRPTPSRKTPWGLVVLLGSLTAMGPLAIDMYLPAVPAMGVDLHASATATQSTVSAFLAGMAVGQFIYGPASDRFGRRVPMLIGIAIFILASAACAMATSIEMLIAARFVQACGACAGQVVSRAAVRDRFDHTETARMLSLLMLIMGLAPILAPLTGGAMLAFGGWRLIFGFITAAALIIGVCAFVRLQESRSEETAAQARAENPLKAYVALLRQRRLIGYGLAGTLNGATLFTYVASSPDLLIGIYKIPAAAFGWVFSLNAIAIIGANQLNRLLLRRWTPDVILQRSSLAAVIAAIGLALAAVTGLGGPFTVLPLLFVLLGSYGFMGGNTMAGALSVDPMRSGSISALLGGASFGAGAIASWAAGVLHDGTPRPMALVMLVCLLGSAVVLRLLALPRRSAQA